MILPSGEFAFELRYVVHSDTSVISALTTASVAIEQTQAIMATLTSNRVSVLVSEGEIRSVANGLALTVDTMIAQEDFVLFSTAIQTLYTGIVSYMSINN